MATHLNLELPHDLAGWREAVKRAEAIYWKARRDGADENKALYTVLDDCLKDRFDYESARRNSGRE
jgi:hypothetical protein